MKQTDINRLQRAVKALEKARNELDALEESVWKQDTEWMNGRRVYDIVKEMRQGVEDERQNAQYKLEALREAANNE